MCVAREPLVYSFAILKSGIANNLAGCRIGGSVCLVGREVVPFFCGHESKSPGEELSLSLSLPLSRTHTRTNVCAQ